MAELGSKPKGVCEVAGGTVNIPGGSRPLVAAAAAAAAAATEVESLAGDAADAELVTGMGFDPVAALVLAPGVVPPVRTWFMSSPEHWKTSMYRCFLPKTM